MVGVLHPTSRAIAAILSSRQGSGYLISPSLVLTAAHVVAPDREALVITPGTSRPVRGRLVWSAYNDECDAALLRLDEGLFAQSTEPLIMGRLSGLQVWPNAQIVGYSDAQRDQQGQLDVDQLSGILKPAAGMLQGTYAVDLNHAVPTAMQEGDSPWAGLSGAPLFVDGLLVGIVRADQARWNNSRILVTPASVLFDDPMFLDACASENFRPTSESLTPQRQEESKFSQKYRDFVVSQHKELTIIGLSRADAHDESWPIDTGYLSLELVAEMRDKEQAEFQPRRDLESKQQEMLRRSQRAEYALAGRRRVLIRGEAGSGKTTLLQWLATKTAQEDLPEPLSEFSGCVPIFLRLRHLVQRESLPSPEDFLSIVAKPLARFPGADGWVSKQLSQGQVLLLVDGVDEVPEGDRERTRSWLGELMAAFPEAWYVVTTRPSAVREGWLIKAHFSELELLPMSRSDIFNFIDKWHDTAAGILDDPKSAELLAQIEGWRSSLKNAILSKPGLAQLATTPLMCALICALNRDRRGYLPEGRMELYAAALEMLLVRRDRERGVLIPEGLQLLRLEEQIQLLQRIAFWLTINSASEINYESAVKIISIILPAIPSVKGTAGEVLIYLLERSGLLRQPTTGTVDFIHRTFQDYLAAMAAVEDDNFGALINHAHEDQWADVFRMAVGHARPKERTVLLKGVLDKAKEGAKHRSRRRLIAAASLEHATALDPSVRQDVQAAIKKLIPPRTHQAAKALARTGTLILDLLPGPVGLNDATREAVVTAAITVGSEQAIPLLARYAEMDSVTAAEASLIAEAWDRFDVGEYWNRVLCLLPPEKLSYVIKTHEQLTLVANQARPNDVELHGDFSDSQIALIPHDCLTSLTLRGNKRSLDLATLNDCSELEDLQIWDCPGRVDLSALEGAPIARLSLLGEVYIAHLDAIETMRHLKHLTIEPGPGAVIGWDKEFSIPEGLVFLRVPSTPLPKSAIRSITACSKIDQITFSAAAIPPSARATWEDLSSLSRLEISGEQLGNLSDAISLPQVRSLWLGSATELDELYRVADIYPNLQELIFYYGDFGDRPPLRLIASLSGCRVSWRNSDERVKGADSWGWLRETIP
ncbi:NACHT domain-containing protein [Streptomyces sp. NBC_01622]|uniref:NACHT domain-containing protein n=1 Tax=Streptomyces sp. NBC_01622 TaxID=2975903 RepID=UPI0038687530